MIRTLFLMGLLCLSMYMLGWHQGVDDAQADPNRLQVMPEQLSLVCAKVRRGHICYDKAGNTYPVILPEKS